MTVSINSILDKVDCTTSTIRNATIEVQFEKLVVGKKYGKKNLSSEKIWLFPMHVCYRVACIRFGAILPYMEFEWAVEGPVKGVMHEHVLRSSNRTKILN